jgi:transposase
MKTITTIGLDMAKSVFQVHGVDAAGQSVIRRQLKRRSVLAFFQKLPSFLVGIEACDSAAAILRRVRKRSANVVAPESHIRKFRAG